MFQGNHQQLDLKTSGRLFNAFPATAAAFLKDPTASEAVKNSKSIAELLQSPDALSKYDAVFLPGGHGIVFDGPPSDDLKRLLEKFLADGKVIAAVCHGPAGLVNICNPDGTPLVAGKTVTGFTDTEEVAVGKDKNVPFLLETKLKELGANFVRGDDWTAYAVR